MEHHGTGSLWSLLCHHQMELLSPMSRYHSVNNHKPFNKFLHGKNVNKVNRWGLELATYNITFEWIFGACNKAVNCLSCLVELLQDKPIPINMLSVTSTDGPAFNTRSQTHQCLSLDTSTSQPDITPEVSEATGPIPKSLTADRLQTPPQMQKTDPFCKRISKHLSNRNAPQHKADLFTHVRGLLYEHITDLNKKFFVLIIPKSWKYTVLVEAHQGITGTYCLIKCQYYWKDMNKDIRRYIANCNLCHREKA